MATIRKHRGLWISAWFCALLIFNLRSHWLQNADRGGLYVFLEALSYLTTPAELALSALIVFGILAVGKSVAHQSPLADQAPSSPIARRAPCALVGLVVLGIMTGVLILYVFRGGTKHKRIEFAQSHAKDVTAAYELMSPATAELGTSDDGLSPETKQRMREGLALQLSGLLEKQGNPMRVDVLGYHHEILQFELASMNDGLSTDLIQELTHGDRNFWNAVRLMNYSQIVFSGNGYQKILSRKDFIGYGKDYEKYKAAFLKAARGLQAGAQGELGKP